MADITDVLKLLAPLSVAMIVFAQGLGVAPGAVLDLFKGRLGLMPRILVAVVILVPAAALAILLVLRADPALAIGLAILVSCPPAPLMVANAPKKGASAALMARLHLVLSLLAFVTVPVVLYALSIPLGFTAVVDLGAMAWTLARTNLLPLALGIALRGLAPGFADRAAPMLAKAGNIGILVVVVVALAKFYPALLNLDAWSYLTIALVSMAALAIGQAAGPGEPQERTALAVECGVRHPSLAIAIGTANFGAARTLPVLFPAALVFMALATVYLSVRRNAISR